MTLKKNPQVDEYLSNAERWGRELNILRAIVLEAGLAEEWKWRQPCYTFQQGNVVILGSFKEYCALSFFKGALLKDPEKILVKPGENTQAGRLIKFTTGEEIEKLEPILKKYLQEAIEIEKAGLKVEFAKDRELELPEELRNKFDQMPAFEKAFSALTPGRQRAYVMFFTAAKQSKTRKARIEKYLPQILDGKGMNDCTCGRSKKLPSCDGSHKYA